MLATYTVWDGTTEATTSKASEDCSEIAPLSVTVVGKIVLASVDRV
jgi:hypothetical protein